ncbi:hypothetical protein HDU76_002716 [Blyttiomyces sp. JEL0837]|nr:hypothetical protein HDU76_002716 [Blyttiomyces sp. JEL0837]
MRGFASGINTAKSTPTPTPSSFSSIPGASSTRSTPRSFFSTSSSSSFTSAGSQSTPLGSNINNGASARTHSNTLQTLSLEPTVSLVRTAAIRGRLVRTWYGALKDDI